MPLILVLVILSFLQGAFMPINLVLMVLISRSFLSGERLNLWLAFWFGLLLSLLYGYPLGSLSIVYLVFVAIIYFIKRGEFFSHWLVVLPTTLIMLFVDSLFRNLLAGSSIAIQASLLTLLEILLILPVYLAVRIWEERFVPKSDIRLRISK